MPKRQASGTSRFGFSTAEAITDIFTEVIIAPAYEPGARIAVVDALAGRRP